MTTRTSSGSSGYLLVASSDKLPLRYLTELHPGYLVALFQGPTRFEVLARWTPLVGRGYNPEDYYRRILMQEQHANHGVELAAAAALLESLSLWDAAGELYRALVAWGSERGERSDEVKGYLGLGTIERLRGEYPDALEHFTAALDLARELGLRLGMSAAIGNMGILHFDQGRYAEAMECYRRNRAISEELGDRRGLAYSSGSMGNVHCAQGRYEDAMECHGRQLAICEAMGDRSGMSIAIGNMGLIHSAQGRYAESLEYHGRQLAICEELGDRRGVAYAVGSMGLVHSVQGRYAVAMECYSRQLAICEELGDRRGMAYAMGSIGVAYWDQGRYTESMECHDRQLAISEELGDRSLSSHAIGSMGLVHSDQGRNAEAMECYGRQLAIYEELGDRWGMSTAFGNMGTVHYALGRYPEAMECFVQALDGHRVIGDLAGVAHWLLGTGRTLLELTGDQRRTDSVDVSDHLGKYLPDITVASWRDMAIAKAREDARECVALSEQLRLPDTIFSGTVLLTRIDAVEGRLYDAQQRLEQMLTEADTDEQRAELHYWRWQIGGQDREKAFGLYQQLVRKAPKHEYQRRIEELQSAGVRV